MSSPPPVFNFDEIPQVVGSPYEYGVPGARHAVLHSGNGRAGRRTPPRRRRWSVSTGPRKVLVVANETLTGEELLDAVLSRVEGAETIVTVIAPVNSPREGYVVYENTRRASAGRRLDRTLALLREAGVAADGHVVDNEPITAVKDAIAMEQPDEIVISTHPDATPAGAAATCSRRCARRPGRSRRARRLGGRDADGLGERPRDRERDRARRAAPRADPRARPREPAGGVPRHLPAERS